MRAGDRLQAPESGPDATASTRERERAGFRPGDILFGRYCLERPLDCNARVWLSRTPEWGAVALKLGSTATLGHEHQALVACAHPHVVRVLAWHHDGPAACLVLEYLAGGDFVSLAGSSVRHWAGAAVVLAAALAQMHAQGFVHRDVKARNVRFDSSGGARLIDFGSAAPIGSAWTRGGTTAEAVDPARGSWPVAPNDDAYALGVLLHEMLHGRPPGSLARTRKTLGSSSEVLERLVAARLEPAAGVSPSVEDFADALKSVQRSEEWAS